MLEQSIKSLPSIVFYAISQTQISLVLELLPLHIQYIQLKHVI